MIDSKINASGQSMTAWISQFFACMGSCLGCCTKSSLFFSVDKSSNGLRDQGQTANKPSLLEDFFSSSTCDLDIVGTLQSQRSLTSTFSKSYQTLLDRHSVAGSMSNPPEFVNDGLLLWNQTRQQWVGDTMPPQPENRTQHVQEPGSSGIADFDLLGSNKMYPQPIPLSEMVYFLVDTWEQEGLYD